MVADVCNILGKDARDRIGVPSVNNRQMLRRGVVPVVPGDNVRHRDAFWIDLEARVTAANSLSRWFHVEARSDGMEEFFPLTELLPMLSMLGENQQEMPVAYNSIQSREKAAMTALATHSVSCLMSLTETSSNGTLSETVLFVVDVFDQVHEVLREVVTLMREDLLEVIGDATEGDPLQMQYQLKEGNYARLEKLMMDRIDVIVLFMEGKLKI